MACWRKVALLTQGCGPDRVDHHVDQQSANFWFSPCFRHLSSSTSCSSPLFSDQVYYVADDVWVQKGMIPTARFRCGAANAGGLAFVFGGADLCPDGNLGCPAQDVVEVYLDVVHPRIYLYLKDQPEESVDIPLGTNQI